MRGKYQIVLLALFAMTLLILPTAARAGTNLGMQLSSTPDTATLCDNNVNFAGCTANASDLDPTTGSIVFIGPVGGWTTNITAGLGPPLEQLQPVLDISNLSITTGGGASPLTILLSVTGLTSPTGVVSFTNSIGGTSSFGGTTITTQAFVSTTNQAFCAGGCGTALTPALVVTGTAFSASASGSANVGSGPYALTLAVTIDSHGQADQTSFDDSLSVPEPATLSILGAGLLALGTGLRKKLLRA